VAETGRVLSAGVGSAVGEVATIDPPDFTTPGTASAGMESGKSMVAAAPGASGPATVQVSGPAGRVPVQPTGNDATLTPAGGVKITVSGPAASDGPLFVMVAVAMPEVPGERVGIAAVVTRSADPAVLVTVGATVLLAGVGSAVAAETDAVPPVSDEDAGASARTRTGMFTEAAAPLASGPTTVQVSGPAGAVPVQFAGTDTISTPAGGEYTKVIGPVASDGPLFVAVRVTVPVVPGVNDGVLAVRTRSDEPAALSTEDAAVLFAGVGSAVIADVTPAEPPVAVVSGAALDASLTGMLSVAEAPLASGPAMVQLSGPVGAVPVQFDGTETMLTPAGGE
jgi:hypothetical protein